MPKFRLDKIDIPSYPGPSATPQIQFGVGSFYVLHMPQSSLQAIETENAPRAPQDLVALRPVYRIDASGAD